MNINITVILLALCLDHCYGELTRYHPLVGFGKLAAWLEKTINRAASQTLLRSRLYGLFSLLILVTPWVIVSYLILLYWLNDTTIMLIVFDGIIVYWAIGHRSLKQHVGAVYNALQQHDIDLAKKMLSRIVSRDASHASETQIVQASIESTLENGNDAVFAALFWYLIAGAPGVIAYRLINTLDAMWGYRNQRFLYFGWAAARLDDVLNYLPARLVAISYALVTLNITHFKKAVHCWQQQASLLASPNAGPVMTAGAGALNVRLGGPTYYHSVLTDKAHFGGTKTPAVNDIKRALQLVDAVVVLWLLCLAVNALFILL